MQERDEFSWIATRQRSYQTPSCLSLLLLHTLFKASYQFHKDEVNR